LRESGKPNPLTGRIEELRCGLAGLDPAGLARRTGSIYLSSDEGSSFRLHLWGKPVSLSYPGFIARDAESKALLPDFNQALLLYYFFACDGEPAAGRWISFSDLPDGRFYNRAFQGYTGKVLVQAFGDDLPGFCKAAEACGGMRMAQGDAAYAFQALPMVSLLAVYWLGDEDFPPSCQILFDAAFSHHMPTDAGAILGSSLTQKLTRQTEKDQGL
jgi:hypothetical protein